MTEETIQKFKNDLKLQNETNKLNNHSLSDAVNLANSIITRDIYNNSSIITIDDVEFTDNFFKDKSIPKRRISKKLDEQGTSLTQINVKFYQTSKLSKILFDIYYPIPDEKLYYHYTKISALRHILKGNLKLNSLIKNDNYEEFKTFYTDHNILGYFNSLDDDGSDMNDSLMREIYTFCMASKNEDRLWRSFGDNKWCENRI